MGGQVLDYEAKRIRNDEHQRTLLEAIKNVMKSTKGSASDAMDIMGIPASEQGTYLKLL